MPEPIIVNGGHDREATLVQTPGSTGFGAIPMDSPSWSGSSGGGPTPIVIPPDHPFRTLVLCFDGTGDQFDSDNSNIVEFFSMLKKDDKMRQLVYYQAGIGTYTTPQIATPLFSKFSKMMDEAIAWNLNTHVMGGYEFLMQNYTAGDRICIFGFSRGAYTARALAGMIHKVGILPKCNHQQVPFAYKMYTRMDDLGWKQSNAFKRAFSIDADIEFIGVWDTVNSVGLIPRTLPFATSNKIVRTFRHALALDERRAKFKANTWNRPTPKEETLSTSDCKIHPHPAGQHHNHEEHDNEAVSAEGNGTEGKNGKKGKNNKKKSSIFGIVQDNDDRWKQKHYEKEFSKDRNIPTDIEEVWFAGCHCDVGGGSVDNSMKNNLARIPLRWMIRECFKTRTGIMFHSESIKEIGIDPDSLWPTVLPRPPPLPVNPEAKIITIAKAEAALAANNDDTSSVTTLAKTQVPLPTEEQLELLDCLQPIYDQLSLKWFWWILELWPIRTKFQNEDNTWTSRLGFNMGQGRHIPKQKKNGVRIHRSVKMRMEAQHEDGSKYMPKANVNFEKVIWVD